MSITVHGITTLLSNVAMTVLYLLPVGLEFGLCESLRQAGFVQSDVTSCLVNVGVTFGQDPAPTSVPTRLRCATQCLQHGGCSKFLFCKHWPNNCNRIRVFGALNTQQTIESCRCYVRTEKLPCENGGELRDSSCECLHGFYGDFCEHVITDCREGYTLGGGVLGPGMFGTAYIRPPDGDQIFPVYCLNMYGGYTFLLHRRGYGETTNFNRTWVEYVRGFGNIEGDYWIGLRQIHLITKSQFFLDIGIIDGKGDFLQAYYNPFSVDGAANDYSVHVGRFSLHPNSLGGADSLTPDSNQNIDGMPFVTFDHNALGSSCPADMRSGWWFATGCTAANLNGPALTISEYNYDKTQPRITWSGMGYIQSAYMRVSDP